MKAVNDKPANWKKWMKMVAEHKVQPDEARMKVVYSAPQSSGCNYWMSDMIGDDCRRQSQRSIQ